MSELRKEQYTGRKDLEEPVTDYRSIDDRLGRSDQQYRKFTLDDLTEIIRRATELVIEMNAKMYPDKVVYAVYKTFIEAFRMPYHKITCYCCNLDFYREHMEDKCSHSKRGTLVCPWCHSCECFGGVHKRHEVDFEEDV